MKSNARDELDRVVKIKRLVSMAVHVGSVGVVVGWRKGDAPTVSTVFRHWYVPSYRPTVSPYLTSGRAGSSICACHQ